MSVQELTKAYQELPEPERILFAALIAADQMAHRGDFAADLERRHAAMDEGKKWSHGEVLKLHEELGKQGLYSSLNKTVAKGEWHEPQQSSKSAGTPAHSKALRAGERLNVGLQL